MNEIICKRKSIRKFDMGIALCHIAQESDNFRFIKESNAPQREGYEYMGTVEGKNNA